MSVLKAHKTSILPGNLLSVLRRSALLSDVCSNKIPDDTIRLTQFSFFFLLYMPNMKGGSIAILMEQRILLHINCVVCTYKNESPSPLLCIDIYCSIWDLTPIFIKHFNSYLLWCIDPLKCVHLIPISLRPEVTPLSDESSENQITLCYRFQLLAFDIRTLGYAALFHTIWYFLVFECFGFICLKANWFHRITCKI